MKRVSTVALIAIILWGSAVLAPVIQAKGADGQALDDEGVQTMLSGLGYEPKKLTKGFLITVKKDTWTYYVQFVLSSDKSRLGMNANLGSVPNPDDVTAAQWRGLLIQNNEIDPSSFNFDKDQKKVYIHRVLENRALTPAYVRQQIENFTANIKDSAEFWKFVK